MRMTAKIGESCVFELMLNSMTGMYVTAYIYIRRGIFNAWILKKRNKRYIYKRQNRRMGDIRPMDR